MFQRSSLLPVALLGAAGTLVSLGSAPAFAGDPKPSVPMVPLAPHVAAKLAAALVGTNTYTWTKHCRLSTTLNSSTGLWLADYSYDGVYTDFPNCNYDKVRLYAEGTWHSVTQNGTVDTYREWSPAVHGRNLSGSGEIWNGCSCTEYPYVFARASGTIWHPGIYPSRTPVSQPFSEDTGVSPIVTLVASQLVVPYHRDPSITGTWGN